MSERTDAPIVIRRRRMILGLLGASILLIVAIVLLLLLRDCCGSTQVLAAYEGSTGQIILFEPLDDVGPHPFMSPSDRSDVTGETDLAPVPGTGLYGGSLSNTCDPEALIAFLRANTQKAEAWAGVHGITVEEIPSFVRSMTPKVLLVDTPVTNHGFRGGQATPRQSILEAGTAVLVDADGVPRARCYCGNPLLEPEQLPPPPACSVVETVELVADWQTGESIGTVEPGDALVVLDFASDGTGTTAIQVRLDDGTVGWIPPDSLTEGCTCVVADMTPYFSDWSSGEPLGFIESNSVVEVLDFNVDDLLGFGVRVALGDGTSGWIDAEALTGSPSFPSAGPVLSKEAVTPGPVASGSTVDWVITYDPESLAPYARVEDHLGPGNTYVPGSAQSPPGWVVDDGDPGRISWVFTGGLGVGSDATTVTSALRTQTIPEFAIDSSGTDGFVPIPWGNRVYFVGHHAHPKISGSGAPFTCVSAVTGKVCAGFPKALPDGDPSTTAASSTATYPEGIVVHDNRLLYPVTLHDSSVQPNQITGGIETVYTPSVWGLGCYDLLTDLECGFVQLGSNSGEFGSPHLAIAEGPWLLSDRAWVFDQNLVLHCVDVTTAALSSTNACGGVSLAPEFGLATPVVPTAWNDGTGLFGQIDGSHLYLTAADRVFCVVPGATGVAACPGWSSAGTFPGAGAYLHVMRDSSMAATAICRGNGHCVSAVGGQPVATPAIFQTALGTAKDLGTEVHQGSRTYFPRTYYDASAIDSVLCIDWTTQAACAGFGSNGLVEQPAAKNRNFYGLGADGFGCVWGSGHAGDVWSFDATTGGPCTGDGASSLATSTPPPGYSCRSGGAGWVWDEFTMTGLDPAQWQSLVVDFVSDDGAVVLQADLLASSGPIDLSGLGSSPASLTYVVNGTPTTGVLPTPILFSMSYETTGTAAEFCFQTVVRATSCHDAVTVVNGVRAAPYGTGPGVGTPMPPEAVVSAVAGVGVVPQLPAQGCVACSDIGDTPTTSSPPITEPPATTEAPATTDGVTTTAAPTTTEGTTTTTTSTTTTTTSTTTTTAPAPSPQVDSVCRDGLGDLDPIEFEAFLAVLQSEGYEITLGTSSNDVLEGTDGPDAIFGFDGNDTLAGFDGDDCLFGGDGDDEILGWWGDDFLAGGRGDDRLEGDDGDDILYGEDGDDDLLGRFGADWLFGGPDDDTLDSNSDPGDYEDGGGGIDTCAMFGGGAVACEQ